MDGSQDHGQALHSAKYGVIIRGPRSNHSASLCLCFLICREIPTSTLQDVKKVRWEDVHKMCMWYPVHSKDGRGRRYSYFKLDVLWVTWTAWVLVAAVWLGWTRADVRDGFSLLWELPWGNLKAIHGVFLLDCSCKKSHAIHGAW